MSLRPQNPPKITLDDLQPGDILLSAGSDMLDQLILYVDQGDYTHTSQYIGKINGVHMVVEATEKGILYQDTGPDMTQDLVDAYRYVSPDGHHFGDPDWPVQPVLDAAKSFVGAEYAYSELLMGAVVIMATEIPDEQNLSIIIRLVLNHLEHDLEKWLDKNEDKPPMTCVQVATSAHWNAVTDPVHKYGLEVIIDNSRKPLTLSKDLLTYQQIRSRIVSKMNLVQPTLVKMLAKRAEITLVAGSDFLPLGSCTPREMETSPSLQFIGCIKDTRK